MKNIVKVAVIFLTIFGTTQANAQFFKKLQSKIEDKIERRLEKKADEKADQALDSVFTDKSSRKRKASKRNEGTSDEEEAQGNFDLSGMMDAMMNREKATYEDSYTFDLTTKMQVATNGRNAMTMTTSYGDGAHYMQMEKGTGDIINDYKNGAMIMLDKKRQTATVMSLNLMNIMSDMAGEETTVEDGDVTIKATGKTKTISGYRCKNYLITSEDMVMDMWTTKDIDFDMKQYAEKMAEVFKNPSSTKMMQQDIGFPMQMTSNTGKDTVEMTILEVSETPKIFDLSAYKISQM